MFNMSKFLEKNFEVRKSGNNIYFCCPFCKDKSYNYWFNPEKSYLHKKKNIQYKGLGRCFRCEKHHNVVSFIMDFKKIDLVTALSMIEGDKNVTFKSLKKKILNLQLEGDSYNFESLLKENINCDIPTGSNSDLPDELINWFENIRGYDRSLLTWLGVKYCWKSHSDPYQTYPENNSNGMKLITLRNRAIFPIKTSNYEGWQAYLYKPGKNSRGESFPKTRNPPGELMHYLLFLYEFVKNDKIIIVNEGIFDSLRTLSRGYSPVCLFGKNLSIQQSYLLNKTSAKEIVMCLDGGEKEEISSIKNCLRLEEIFEGDISIMRLPHGIDPDDVQDNVFAKTFRDRKIFKRNAVFYDGFNNVIGYNWHK